MPLLTLATTEIRSKEPKKSATLCCHVLLHMGGVSEGSNYEMMNLLGSGTQLAGQSGQRDACGPVPV